MWYDYLTPLTFILLGVWFLVIARKVPPGKEKPGRIMTIAAVVMIVSAVVLIVRMAMRG